MLSSDENLDQFPTSWEKTKQKWKVQSKENIPISLVEMTSLLLNLLGSFDYLS